MENGDFVNFQRWSNCSFDIIMLVINLQCFFNARINFNKMLYNILYSLLVNTFKKTGRNNGKTNKQKKQGRKETIINTVNHL